MAPIAQLIGYVVLALGGFSLVGLFLWCGVSIFWDRVMRPALTASDLLSRRSAMEKMAKRIDDLEIAIQQRDEALARAVSACSWAESALERYDNALGLDCDKAALVALEKCWDVVAAARAPFPPTKGA